MEKGELKLYKLNVMKIDRVYYTYGHDGLGIGCLDYKLLGRMRYGFRMSYFALEASCDSTRFGLNCQGKGYIYVTFDPQIFLKSIVKPDQDPHKIWTLMQEDGLKVYEPTQFDLLPEGEWTSAPMLEYLCHLSIYKHTSILADEAAKALPPLLAGSVEEFIRTRDTRDHYSIYTTRTLNIYDDDDDQKTTPPPSSSS